MDLVSFTFLLQHTGSSVSSSVICHLKSIFCSHWDWPSAPRCGEVKRLHSHETRRPAHAQLDPFLQLRYNSNLVQILQTWSCFKLFFACPGATFEGGFVEVFTMVKHIDYPRDKETRHITAAIHPQLQVQSQTDLWLPDIIIRYEFYFLIYVL